MNAYETHYATISSQTTQGLCVCMHLSVDISIYLFTYLLGLVIHIVIHAVLT